MPYTIRKDGSEDKPFCVHKKTEDNPLAPRMGCHATREAAEAQMKALYAAEAAASIAESLAVEALQSTYPSESVRWAELAYDEKIPVKEFPWEGPIVFEGVLTGDNRVFKVGSIEWDDDTLPWPFRWQKASIKGHDGAVPVGRLDKIERKEDGLIYGYGAIIPSLNDEAAEYLRLLEAGVASGVSVDGDSAVFDIQESNDGVQVVEFSKMRLRSLTAVDIPAFDEARVDLAEKDEDDEEEDLVKYRKRRRKLSRIYKMSKQDESESLTAAAIPVKPPLIWFKGPELDGPTPVTVTKKGEVFGHLALFDTCHIGFPGCVTPPKGSSYKYFHTGEVETEEGDTVAVGHLTFNTGHAALSDSAKAAAVHYDHTGTVAADVIVGEDKHGIWVAGALRSTLSDEEIRAFRAAPLSGDWRRIAGKLELIGALAVNVPGFPVPRARAVVASGETEALFTFQDVVQVMCDKKEELAGRVADRLGFITLQDDEDKEADSDEDTGRPKPITKEEGKKLAQSLTKEQFKKHVENVKELWSNADKEFKNLPPEDVKAMEEFIKIAEEKLASLEDKASEASILDGVDFHLEGKHDQADHAPGGRTGFLRSLTNTLKPKNREQAQNGMNESQKRVNKFVSVVVVASVAMVIGLNPIYAAVAVGIGIAGTVVASQDFDEFERQRDSFSSSSMVTFNKKEELAGRVAERLGFVTLQDDEEETEPEGETDVESDEAVEEPPKEITKDEAEKIVNSLTIDQFREHVENAKELLKNADEEFSKFPAEDRKHVQDLVKLAEERLNSLEKEASTSDIVALHLDGQHDQADHAPGGRGGMMRSLKETITSPKTAEQATSAMRTSKKRALGYTALAVLGTWALVASTGPLIIGAAAAGIGVAGTTMAVGDYMDYRSQRDDFRSKEGAAAKRTEIAGRTFSITLQEGEVVCKTEGDAGCFPASDYAYVPDSEKVSDWKLRLTDTPGGDPDSRIIGAAVAALGEGFRGQKVEVPEEDLPEVIKKVRAAWLKANPDKTEEDLPDIIKK